MTNDDLDLPFDYNFTLTEAARKWGMALVCSTRPSPARGGDRRKQDILTVLKNNDETGDSLIELARFMTAALNAFVSTKKGLAQWKAVHALLLELRNAHPPTEEASGTS